MKSIFKSKTLWLNVVGAALAYGNLLPQKYAVPVMTVANVVNRFLTTGPVSVTGR